MSLPSDCLLLEDTPDDVAVARLNLARLGEWEAEQVRGRLFELATGRPGLDFCLDLGRLEYLSSSGLALLLALHGRVKAEGGRLSLCNVREGVHEVFALTRVNSILDVHRLPAQDVASSA
jgi:anti-anti-sigma factor